MLTFITREQDYALRIAAMLAGLPGGQQLSIKQLSEKLLISKKFAARISHKLKHGGIIGSKQGQSGGIFLIKNPNKLSLWEVLDIIGFRTKFNQCLDESFICGLSGYCKFHNLFGSIELNIITTLKEKMISDFVMRF